MVVGFGPQSEKYYVASFNIKPSDTVDMHCVVDRVYRYDF